MRGNETQYYKISEACDIIGVKPGILRQWDARGLIKTIRTPGGMRLFDISTINPSITIKKTNERSVVLYSRVSSAKQKDDLARQKEYIRDNLPDKYTGCKINNISDIGSGINFKRPGLLQVLGSVKEGTISTIVVASKDRLARFGIELIEWMCQQYGTKILVLDSEDSTPENELGKDLMAIVQVYCCRWNGQRRYSKTQKQVPQVEIESNEDPTIGTQSLGGLCEVPLQQDNCTLDQS